MKNIRLFHICETHNSLDTVLAILIPFSHIDFNDQQSSYK